MPRRKTYAEKIAGLEPTPGKRETLFDPETEGLCLRTSLAGAKSLYVVAKERGGKQRWYKLGNYVESDQPGGITLADARNMAPEIVGRIKDGLDPVEKAEEEQKPEEPEEGFTFAKLAEQFMARYVIGKRRGADQTQYIIDTYLLPAFGSREVSSITRSEINGLLDRIEDRKVKGSNGKTYGGPVMADRTLAALSKMFAWHMTRNDTFASPIVRGMRRTSPTERARTRILSDAELRALWTVTEAGGSFNALVRFMLLTAQRRGKCAGLQWNDIGDDGVWHIRPDETLAAREKGTAGDLPLSDMALQVVRSQPRLKSNEFVFSGRVGHFKGFNRSKDRLDELLLEALRKDDPGAELEQWTLHDLRRSARSLMARAKVPPHVAEIALGHVQGGVLGIYDRYTYEAEKKEALDALAGLVERIVKPPKGRAVPRREAAA